MAERHAVITNRPGRTYSLRNREPAIGTVDTREIRPDPANESEVRNCVMRGRCSVRPVAWRSFRTLNCRCARRTPERRCEGARVGRPGIDHTEEVCSSAIEAVIGALTA